MHAPAYALAAQPAVHVHRAGAGGGDKMRARAVCVRVVSKVQSRHFYRVTRATARDATTTDAAAPATNEAAAAPVVQGGRGIGYYKGPLRKNTPVTREALLEFVALRRDIFGITSSSSPSSSTVEQPSVAAAAAAAAAAVGGPITGALRRLAAHQTGALVRSLVVGPALDETLDVLFRHRLLLLQARKGYRCNVDSLVLAAHVAAQLPWPQEKEQHPPPEKEQHPPPMPMRIADLGAGAGVIGLSLALRGGVGGGVGGGGEGGGGGGGGSGGIGGGGGGSDSSGGVDGMTSSEEGVLEGEGVRYGQQAAGVGGGGGNGGGGSGDGGAPRVLLVEQQPSLARRCARNAALNGVGHRVRVWRGDVAGIRGAGSGHVDTDDDDVGIGGVADVGIGAAYVDTTDADMDTSDDDVDIGEWVGRCDAVVCNPPYFPADLQRAAGTPPRLDERRLAHYGGGPAAR
jgi:tRNA1(Val) A37 N6-methylase TrmN6